MNKLYIDPSVSPKVKQYIQAGQQMLFSVKTAPVLKQMITGAKSLTLSVPPFLSQLVMGLESKLGPLEQHDEAMLIMHLAGYIVDYASDMGDPETKHVPDKKLVAQIALKVHQMMGGGQQQQQQAQPQQPPQQQQPPLAQLGGMQ